MHLDLYHCQGVRVVRHMPYASNAITLEVASETGRCAMTLYRLPADVTAKLMAAFADQKTEVHHAPQNAQEVAA